MTRLLALFHPRPLVDLPTLRALTAAAQESRVEHFRLARTGR